jgi:hypothetical protein
MVSLRAQTGFLALVIVFLVLASCGRVVFRMMVVVGFTLVAALVLD